VKGKAKVRGRQNDEREGKKERRRRRCTVGLGDGLDALELVH